MCDKKIKRKICKIMGKVFCLFLLFFFMVSIIVPKKTFSPTENRMLEARPKFSAAQILNGRYMTQYETYKADQFVGRDYWMQLKTTVDSLLGKHEQHGIYKGKNNYLMEKIKKPDEKMLHKNLQTMLKFQSKYKAVPMKMLLIPNAAYILEEKLPKYALNEKQEQSFQEIEKKLQGKIEWFDAVSVLKKHRSEPIYYHTDHHWTTLGANYVYQDFIKKGKKEQLVKYKPYLVSDSFNGTLSASSGYERNQKENIYIYTPVKDSTEYVVEYVEEEKKTTTVYEEKHLKEKDQYALFLDGNHSMIDIKTTAKSTERLLVFKDSYANCFIPFLIPYYREIILIDPRYYSGDIDACMEENDISEVLFLYNGNTFVEDHNIAGVIQSE